MKQRCSALFVAQRASYGLRFTCEHCSHFQAERERCVHGYPSEVHRAARYEDASEEVELVFCKDFDLRWLRSSNAAVPVDQLDVQTAA